ncbi:MAG: VCBS repeat-containing protein [Phycisphaerales bacterium]
MRCLFLSSFFHRWHAQPCLPFPGFGLYTGLAFARAIHFGDLDQDGDLDFVVPGGDFIRIYENDGTGNFNQIALYYTIFPATRVKLVDLNNDSWLDIYMSIAGDDQVVAYFNDGTGQFPTVYSNLIGFSPKGIDAGDIDGDGFADLVVANESDGTIRFLINDGDDTFTPMPAISAGTEPEDVLLGDLDNDGDPDLIITEQTTSTAMVRLNNGSGVFSQVATLTLGNSPEYGARASQRRFIPRLGCDERGRQLGERAPGPRQWAVRSDRVLRRGCTPSDVTIGDLDGDGDQDLAVSNFFDRKMHVLMNQGGGSFLAPWRTRPRLFSQSVAIGDVNNDGHLDIGVANGIGDSVNIFMNNGVGAFADR